MGGCFSSWKNDDAIASTVLGLVGAERYKSNMVLEVKQYSIFNIQYCTTLKQFLKSVSWVGFVTFSFMRRLCMHFEFLVVC